MFYKMVHVIVINLFLNIEMSRNERNSLRTFYLNVKDSPGAARLFFYMNKFVYIISKAKCNHKVKIHGKRYHSEVGYENVVGYKPVK